jgi:hypothetical protein
LSEEEKRQRLQQRHRRQHIYSNFNIMGMCLALLYMMRVDSKTVEGRTLVPFCKYVALHAPPIKDLPQYSPRLSVRLMSDNTEILKLLHQRMIDSGQPIPFDKIEEIVY